MRLLTKIEGFNSNSKLRKRILPYLNKYKLIENEDEYYMSKYLKYKMKYLELKQKLNI